MQVRTVAAIINGFLVLALYVAAWGVPSFMIGLTEVGLSVAAALSTWYAVKTTCAPNWTARFIARAGRGSAA
jgi:hypothetical protein